MNNHKSILIFLLFLVPGLGSAQPKNYGEWYPVKVNPGYDGSHYVDWSSLLDPPAGKHGFVQAKGNDVYFENGTPAKFWGTNITAGECFPVKSKADSIVKRLSLMGCNILRFHHMDADWANPNIFGNKENTLTLDPEMLDRLDYFIARLKEKGIYFSGSSGSPRF